MLIPGCSASSPDRPFFSTGQRRPFWNEVISLIGLIFLLFLNYSFINSNMTTTYFEANECPVKIGATPGANNSQNL